MTLEKEAERQPILNREVLVIDPRDEELDYLLKMASQAPKKRFIKPLHEAWEHESRTLIAIMPESYTCPYRHESPHSTNTLQAIRGYFSVLIFDGQGEITSLIPVYDRRVVSIPPGKWHTVVVHTRSVLYETRGHDVGGYNPATDKVFPDWAPEEGAEEAEEYLVNLKSQVEERTLR